MGRDEYVSLMAAFKQRSIADLPGRLQVTILRTFRADSNTGERIPPESPHNAPPFQPLPPLV